MTEAAYGNTSASDPGWAGWSEEPARTRIKEAEIRDKDERSMKQKKRTNREATVWAVFICGIILCAVCFGALYTTFSWTSSRYEEVEESMSAVGETEEAVGNGVTELAY